MKRITFLLSLLLLPIVGTAQEFQGKAVYQSKALIDFQGRGPQMDNMPEAQRKMIMERMKQAFEKTYTLSFNRTQSLYKEQESLEQPGMGGGNMFMAISGNFSSGNYHKDITEGRYQEQRELFGKMFLISDSLPRFDWQMTGETKTIGKYTCYKATAMKKVDTPDIGNLPQSNGENNDSIPRGEDNLPPSMEDIELPEEVEVTAWYTLDIPVNQGPGEYWGLPGLIMEVSAGSTTILCSKITLNPKEKEKIKAPSGGKKVSQAEFNIVFKKKMMEMRENFRNRGGGPPPGVFGNRG